MQNTSVNSQFITFRMGDEVFAADVFRIREILEIPQITKVPGMPKQVEGVINLRGDVVPVIDLLLHFTGKKTTLNDNTAIIVAEIKQNNETVLVGLLVDEAKEVVSFNEDELEQPPSLGIFIDNRYLAAMGKKDDSFVIILNMDELLRSEELGLAAYSGLNEAKI